jgi:hypothetical protein
VERVLDGVALDDLRDGVDEVVEDEVEPQQAGGFLGDVLREDGAAVFPDGVRHVHEQGAGTGGGIVAGDVSHRPGDEAAGHDLRDGVGRVILGVFAAAVLVVVLDEVFEEGGEEVELFGEDALEGEVDDLVDDGTGELVALGGDVFGEGIEERDFFAVLGFHGEDIGIERGDGEEGGVQGFREVRLVLPAVEGGEEMLRPEVGGAIAELHEEHFVIAVLHLAQLVLPGSGLGELRVDAFHLMGEFVVEELVEEDLGDDLVFVAVIAEAVVGADGLEVVDEGDGLDLEVAGGHGERVTSDR